MTIPPGAPWKGLDCPVIVSVSATTGSYPLPKTVKRPRAGRFLCVALISVVVLTACSSNPAEAPPPTIVPASAAVSPPVTTVPAGRVLPLPVVAKAAVFDAATSSLVVLGVDGVTVVPAAGEPHSVALPSRATALAGDGRGVVYLSTRGGYLRVDVHSRETTALRVDGHADTEFTAIARRSDGRLVLGSADGGVYTLGSDTAVAAEVKAFSRVDSLVTQGNTAVVLDRGQTSVTTIDASGSQMQHALRAGEGATTLAADPVGRVLVADTRGEELLVFGTDPLMMRQRYPVRNAPYGLAAARRVAWVSLTAINVVVGYDLATGIPVEKVRYPTVRQPDVLAFDEATDTLFVVSASKDGVQVIENAGRQR